MTDTTEPNKIQQMFQNDVDIVLQFQKLLLESSEMNLDQLYNSYRVYGELYHPYAINMFDRLNGNG